jgi:hypothetical protein
LGFGSFLGRGLATLMASLQCTDRVLMHATLMCIVSLLIITFPLAKIFGSLLFYGIVFGVLSGGWYNFDLFCCWMIPFNSKLLFIKLNVSLTFFILYLSRPAMRHINTVTNVWQKPINNVINCSIQTIMPTTAKFLNQFNYKYLLNSSNIDLLYTILCAFHAEHLVIISTDRWRVLLPADGVGGCCWNWKSHENHWFPGHGRCHW